MRCLVLLTFFVYATNAWLAPKKPLPQPLDLERCERPYTPGPCCSRRNAHREVVELVASPKTVENLQRSQGDCAQRRARSIASYAIEAIAKKFKPDPKKLNPNLIAERWNYLESTISLVKVSGEFLAAFKANTSEQERLFIKGLLLEVFQYLDMLVINIGECGGDFSYDISPQGDQYYVQLWLCTEEKKLKVHDLSFLHNVSGTNLLLQSVYKLVQRLCSQVEKR